VPARTEVLMGTLVTIDVVGAGNAADAIDRAFSWFHHVEATCSRFDASSELMRLCARSGEAVRVSPLLLEAVGFAVAVAGETGGAFDPTVGAAMMARGFDREHRSGVRAPAPCADPGASYRDIRVDADESTITLARPLVLDLGALAKGLAVDMAGRELEPLGDFAIDAGGDLLLRGRNHRGEPWTVGIRHPRLDGELVETIRVSGVAVCTSGDYERADHLADPRSGATARQAASVTVMAPNAMLADALATAAFVLGPHDGIALLERQGVEGVLYTGDLARFATPGFPHG
jgi:thiamine biosynthesis lipoprotein